ncbi:hypothetical protein B0I37DRAFT_363409 [Chaetomium sp. MPI-CAGE-AT-0009]|nr:hypothetical protein B0I37DRAFT_363409 [Chaetomium sp. MPI-CAGE-AT-0009]
MLCGIQHSPPHHHHHSLLRSFRTRRSHRHRKDSTADSLSSQEEMHHHHRHVPSDASSLARPSLDSTSSRRTDLSIDWDPLRLHPSLASGPSPPLQDAFSDSTSRRYQPHELRHARSCQDMRRPSTSHHQPTQSTVIYGGFNFGFNNKPTPVMTKPATASDSMRRAPSPTPSDVSSEYSFSLSEPSDEEMGLGLGLSPAPALRSRPRPRPYHDGGADEAEYFMRRGDWKRRGIVFVNSGSPLAGEDETFEI